MAKQRKKTKPEKTISKNGKRVPASEKGKAEKKKPKPAADGAAAKEKAERKAAIARNVARMTKTSRTLMGQLHALVIEGWDEPDAKQQALKEQIGGLTGQIAKHAAEVRQTAREVKENGGSVADAKKLAGLEQDIERWMVKKTGLVEERKGYRETMKTAWAEVRRLVKDKASGQMRIDDPPEEKAPAPGKSPSPTSESASKDGPKPSPKTPAPPTSNGTPPPSTSQASPAPSPAQTAPSDEQEKADHIKSQLAHITCADVIGEDQFPLAIQDLKAGGVTSLTDAAARGKTYLIRNCNLLPNLAQRIFDRIHEIRTGEKPAERAA